MVFFSSEKFVFEMDEGSPLKKMRTIASERSTLNHYTSMESLFKILDTKTLKMNSIKSLNDKEEARFISIDNIEDLVFISSFCNKGESIPLWHMYTEKKYGVNIAFNYTQSRKCFSNVIYDETRPILGKISRTNNFAEFNSLNFKDNVTYSNDWSVEIFESDVTYDENGIDPYTVVLPNKDEGNSYNLTSLGVVKNSAWSYENETRLVAYFRTTKNEVEMSSLDFILIPIKFESLDNITITFSPWMSAETKEAIRIYISDRNISCEVIYKDSVFTKVIERKF